MPTLLCADPNRELCQILSRALGADGFRVEIANDGEAAIAMLRDSPPDVAVLDMALPRRDGLAVLEAMRLSASPAATVPVILWSDFACSADQVDRARKLGASALLRKPVPLDALVARAAKLVARERDARKSRGPAEPQRAKRVAALRGTLAEMPFPALLHQAHGLRANGVLQLYCGEKRKEIELRDGRPAAVRSNLANERLGEWLLASGRIEPAVLAESARRLLRGEGLQGQILVGMQVLSPEDLAATLLEQAEEKLLEIFEWESGEFALGLGAQLARATALPLVRSAADVIHRGVRQRFSIERVDATLGAHAAAIIAPSANPFYSFQDIALGEDERKMLDVCAKGVSVKAVLGKSERVRRVAYGLLETGLLELRDGETFRRGGHAAVVRLHAKAAPMPKTEAARVAPKAAPAKPAAPKSAPKPVAAQAAAPAASAPTTQPAGGEDHSHFAADHAQRTALTALLERLGNPSPFEKLGVARDATDEGIRSAYMRLAKETHPDRYANASQAARDLAEQAFREVTRAYEVLSDPARLAVYRDDPLRDRKESQALDEAQRAISAEREFQRGEARLRSHDWSGALTHFERAVELYPEEGEYVAYCGWAYYLTHGHADDVFRHAFALVKRGAKLAPDRDKPYLFLGRLCQAAGRLELAERMFTKAVECRPDSIEALRELRLLQMRRPKRGLLGRLLGRKPEKGRGRRD
jgi:CheY-like chemotaxis protein